jgi:hypothetical protein
MTGTISREEVLEVARVANRLGLLEEEAREIGEALWGMLDEWYTEPKNKELKKSEQHAYWDAFHAEAYGAKA